MDRRSFIKNLGLGAAAVAVPTVVNAKPTEIAYKLQCDCGETIVAPTPKVVSVGTTWEKSPKEAKSIAECEFCGAKFGLVRRPRCFCLYRLS